ncbi:MAG TPA: hypothetical protein DCX89_00950 [Saprospirales bacterium]|nr:hypothetical protein [Saprospirales bacterium]HAY70433.1 hypothetical protein [Saprospirales bacterium]HRQ29708.1 hypothetical protein [Saprospiraceae bacterium]
MDKGSAIMGAVLIALIIIPFIIYSQNARRKKSQLLKQLKALASANNGQISRHEFSGHTLIGMDENKLLVFFIKKIHDQMTEQVVDLAGIQEVKIYNGGKVINNQNAEVRIGDKLEMGFIPRDSGQLTTKLEFFNVKDNFQLHTELLTAEKWAGEINQLLKK